MGRKKQPHYRVVVADSQSPRDGRFVETLGFYKPLSQPARLVLDLERVDYWLGQGAQPSGTVKSLISKARAGGTADMAVGRESPEEAKAKRAEALAARRAEEAKKAEEAKQAEEAAAAEAAAAEAEAAAAAEAEEAAAPEEDAGAPAEPEAAAEEAPADEASEDADAEEKSE